MITGVPYVQLTVRCGQPDGSGLCSNFEVYTLRWYELVGARACPLPDDKGWEYRGGVATCPRCLARIDDSRRRLVEPMARPTVSTHNETE